MTTLRQQLLSTQERLGENVEFIVLGDREPDWDAEQVDQPVLTLEQVPAEVLDREFDSGWGGTEGTPIMAWTKNFVIFSCQYDGSEWLSSIARNPIPTNPGFHGGG